MRDEFDEKFRQRWEERRQRWRERMEHRSKYGHIWTGLFILIIGIAALVKASVTDLPDWVFSWQSFLILLGLFVGVKHGFRGGSWFILMLVGSAFLWPEINHDIEIRRYIWPGALILLGAFLMLRPRHRHQLKEAGAEKKRPDLSGLEEATVIKESNDTKEDWVDSTSVFGGAKKNIISKNFKGGDLVNIFGGTELDLTRADFTGTAVVELTTIFGGTKLIVPSNWTVKSEAVTIFGGLEDKRNMQTALGDPEKILLLKGTVIFGGIEIKSF